MPSPVRYTEVERLLRRYGWTLLRVRGSHHVWHKAGVGVFPVPVHGGKVKHGYYKELLKLCGQK